MRSIESAVDDHHFRPFSTQKRAGLGYMGHPNHVGEAEWIEMLRYCACTGHECEVE